MRLESMSKFISLILRHKPEVIGITLDEHGWADVADLIEGVCNSGKELSFSTLVEIVETDEKQRYSFNPSRTLIRANQGHSIPVDVELDEVTPPEFLYHGTAKMYVRKIKEEGIKHMSRLYVHLSKDIETATKVGKRHGEPTILKVHTGEMAADGVKFYLSANGVWLTDYVNPKYFEVIE